MMSPSLTHPRSPLRLIPVIYIGECLSAVVADKQASNSSIDQGGGSGVQPCLTRAMNEQIIVY